MLIIISKFLIPRGFRGITIFPFIVIKEDLDAKNLVLINHEKIHIRQQLEMLVLPFYFIYVLDYLLKTVRYKDKNIAYRNIIFEKEAYSNERNINYLKKRAFWNWLRYL
ncbi:hypothetical protein [Flavobacterium luteum]|uniref:Peptidase M56 domain-containing protein n=1 Tax=Flavobacterium luteum TaxID=2026654 RepID=A0A7J5AGF7_9FLAO|nr:hypothetical protein [Flavobacterium luteum]KAB1156600.1 hypothetical protein F6464_04405 [Flavobacterium luteum]